MASVMWQRGRRLFSSAAVLMILTAAAHTAGHFSPGSGPDEERVISAMAGFHIPLGLGMNPSILQIYKNLSLTMTITFLAIGSLNLLLAASRDTSERLLLRVKLINVVWVGAFLILCVFYQVTPPLLSALIIEVLLLASLVMPTRHPKL
jgi:hypothetical protein